MSARGCDAHGGVPVEVRALAEQLTEALEPWAQRLRDAADEGDRPTGPATCTWCPVCAVMGLLRGERPELAARLAEHGVGMLTAVRELLAEVPDGQRAPGPGGPGAGDAGAGGDRRKSGAQRIPVRHAGREQPGAGGDPGC
ncbi:MAG: hypothetical protein GEV09_20235 [Pseudonocardiaceae bacterium]|nr:hypothetical protein [Pseudonocardiaceae bacterium]